MREDRADRGSQLIYMLPCLQTYKQCNVEYKKTIVLDFHLTCYRRIKDSCQHDKMVQRRGGKV